MLKISSLFEAYITNLGKYNEGRLVGETLKFPATTEEVQALLKRIGVDGYGMRKSSLPHSTVMCWACMTIWASMKVLTS